MRWARQLADLLAELGPTFIKIGQALSIRADLLPAAYCEALASLQVLPMRSAASSLSSRRPKQNRSLSGLFV